MIPNNDVTAPQQLTPEEKRKFVAFLMSQYGIAMDVDNELLPVYYLAYQSGLLTEQIVKTLSLQMQRVAKDLKDNANEFKEGVRQSLLKLEPKQVNFSSAGQAFWYRFASPGLPLVCIIGVIFYIWHYYEHASRQKEHRQVLIPFIEKSQLVNIKLGPHMHVQVIKLSEASSLKDAQAGEEFVYDQKCKCVLVPIDYGVHY